MSPAERLINIINSTENAPISAAEIPSELQIDIAGLRSLSYEMKDRIGRNIAARNASVRSAATTTTR